MKNDILTSLKETKLEKGCLTREGLKNVGVKHSRDLTDVYSVSTFYSETSPNKRGKYQINLCKSLPCRIKNMEDILVNLKDELNIGPGETTEDGKFSINLVNCIGACDVAPAMLINGKLYGNLTSSKINQILKELK